jgi:hypothetical protein
VPLLLHTHPVILHHITISFDKMSSSKPRSRYVELLPLNRSETGCGAYCVIALEVIDVNSDRQKI